MKFKAPALALAATLALPLAPAPALADATSDAIQQLKDQIAALNQRIAELEQANRQQAEARQQPAPAGAAGTGPAQVAAAPAGALAAAAPPAGSVAALAASWADKVSLNGNFRFRYEDIDQEGSAERNRERMRGQLAVVAKPEDNIEVGFGLTTSTNNDPVSANQTFDNGSSQKDVYINLAYFNWTAMKGLNVVGGKMKNVLFRPGANALLWDPDLDPEGGALVFTQDKFFANAVWYWMNSDSNSSKGNVAGGQAGVAWPFANGAKLTAGVGYYSFGTAGKGVFYTVSGQPANFYGNSNANGEYLYNYDEMEGFGQLNLTAANLPVSLFFDYVENRDPSHNNKGWSAGASIGSGVKKGTWLLGYTYQDLQEDAVFGLWTDSDFGGGGTDNSGSIFRGVYAFSDRTNLTATYFLNQIDKDAGDEKDYNRLQVDFNFRY